MKPALLALLAWCALLRAEVPTTPDVGAAAYARGDYALAAETWQAQADQEGVSSGLLAALGDAEWKLGRKGRAVLCWERALLLNPRDPVALAGLRHAQAAGGVERPTPTWFEEYASVLGADVWLLLGGAAFWTVVACLLTPRLRRRPAGPWNQRLRLLAATLLVLTLPGLWGAHTHAARAVVRRGEVALRLTPTALGEPLGGVAEGDVVRTARTFNGYWRVTGPDGRTGWVKAGEVEPVWGGGLPADLDRKESP